MVTRSAKKDRDRNGRHPAAGHHRQSSSKRKGSSAAPVVISDDPKRERVRQKIASIRKQREAGGQQRVDYDDEERYRRGIDDYDYDYSDDRRDPPASVGTHVKTYSKRTYGNSSSSNALPNVIDVTCGDDTVSPNSSEAGYHLTTASGSCAVPLGVDGRRSKSSSNHKNTKRWIDRRLPLLSKTFSNGPGASSREYEDRTVGMIQTLSAGTFMTSDEDGDYGDASAVGGGGFLGSAATFGDRHLHNKSGDSVHSGDYLKTKQSVAVMSICVTVVQLLMLMLQFALCGIASLDVNPMIGPFPDAFSEFGGKNAYLTKVQGEWWRLITPSFLHVGFLHLLANAFCQLEAIALFEREWGSTRWVLIYLISSVGCNAFGCLFDPDNISVGSSGALMGLYGAKLAQVGSHVFFDVNKTNLDDGIRLDQLSSVLCGLTIVSLLSCFTYIDWSGHMGGLLTGSLAGMFLFSYPIKSCCSWFFWSAFGFLGLVASLTSVLYFFVTEGEVDNEMYDACEYFRNLFPETYECGCMWQ